MPIISDYEQFWLDYIKARYPAWLRLAQDNENSIVWKYDYVNVFAVTALNSLIEAWADQLTIWTATEIGLLAWEEFLNIPEGTGKSFDTRRGIIRSKLWAKFTTIENLRAVIKAFLPEGVAYQIVEYWKDTDADPNAVFNYSVLVPEGTMTNNEYDTMLEVLRNIHPTHCNLILTELVKIADSIGTSDEITYIKKHLKWIRADKETDFPVVWTKQLSVGHDKFYNWVLGGTHWDLMSGAVVERDQMSLLWGKHVSYGKTYTAVNDWLADGGITCSGKNMVFNWTSANVKITSSPELQLLDWCLERKGTPTAFTGQQYLVSKGRPWTDSSGNNVSYAMYTTSDGSVGLFFEQSNWADRLWLSSYNLPSWVETHLVGMYDYTIWEFRIYANWVLVDSHNIGQHEPEKNNKNVSIGAWRLTTPQYFYEGTVEYVRIYNRPLSASEVTDVYNQKVILRGMVLWIRGWLHTGTDAAPSVFYNVRNRYDLSEIGLTSKDEQTLCRRVFYGDSSGVTWLWAYNGRLNMYIQNDGTVLVEANGIGWRRYFSVEKLQENQINSIVIRINNYLWDNARVSNDVDFIINGVLSTKTTSGIWSDTSTNRNFMLGSKNGTTNNNAIDKYDILEFVMFDKAISTTHAIEWHNDNPRKNVVRGSFWQILIWEMRHDLFA